MKPDFRVIYPLDDDTWRTLPPLRGDPVYWRWHDGKIELWPHPHKPDHITLGFATTLLSTR